VLDPAAVTVPELLNTPAGSPGFPGDGGTAHPPYSALPCPKLSAAVLVNVAPAPTYRLSFTGIDAVPLFTSEPLFTCSDPLVSVAPEPTVTVPVPFRVPFAVKEPPTDKAPSAAREPVRVSGPAEPEAFAVSVSVSEPETSRLPLFVKPSMVSFPDSWTGRWGELEGMHTQSLAPGMAPPDQLAAFSHDEPLVPVQVVVHPEVLPAVVAVMAALPE